MKVSDVLDAAKKEGTPFAEWMAFEMEWEAVKDDSGNIICENVKNDRGGLTFAGVDKKNHPWFPYQNPTVPAVLRSYRDDWNAVRAGELPAPLGAVAANYAVNSGPGPAAHLLQIALQRFPVGKGIAVDGHIGPITLGAAIASPTLACAHACVDAGELFYQHLAEHSARLRGFLSGWHHRDQSLDRWISTQEVTDAEIPQSEVTPPHPPKPEPAPIPVPSPVAPPVPPPVVPKTVTLTQAILIVLEVLWKLLIARAAKAHAKALSSK